jgi:hypothetical protein
MSKIGSNRNTSSSPFDQVCASVVEELFSPKLPPLFYLFFGYGLCFLFTMPFGHVACLHWVHASFYSQWNILFGCTSFFLFVFSAMPSWVVDLFSHGAPMWVCIFYSSLFYSPYLPRDFLERVTFGYTEQMVWNVYVNLIAGVSQVSH